MLNQKKCFSILLLVMLVGTMFIVPELTYPVDLDGEVEELLESKNNIPALDSISNEIDSSKTKQSVIDSSIKRFYIVNCINILCGGKGI